MAHKILAWIGAALLIAVHRAGAATTADRFGGDAYIWRATA
jgi:hypothetical protein